MEFTPPCPPGAAVRQLSARYALRKQSVTGTHTNAETRLLSAHYRTLLTHYRRIIDHSSGGGNEWPPGATGAPPVKQNSVHLKYFATIKSRGHSVLGLCNFQNVSEQNFSEFWNAKLSNREISQTKNCRTHLYFSEELKDAAGTCLVSVCIQKLQEFDGFEKIKCC